MREAFQPLLQTRCLFSSAFLVQYRTSFFPHFLPFLLFLTPPFSSVSLSWCKRLQKLYNISYFSCVEVFAPTTHPTPKPSVCLCCCCFFSSSLRHLLKETLEFDLMRCFYWSWSWSCFCCLLFKASCNEYHSRASSWHSSRFQWHRKLF